MLYLTTAGNGEVYTAPYTLNHDYSPDGGFFVPYSIPSIGESELSDWKNKNFNQVIANVLSIFFPAHLTSWDVDFCIGRNAIRLVGISRLQTVAELWHNPASDFSYAVKNLYTKVSGNEQREPTVWFTVAVRIAFLFGIYTELCRTGALNAEAPFEVSADTGDFATILAAVYGKKMGLPVGKILCVSAENGAVWDLIHRGVYTPALGVAAERPYLESVLLSVLGSEEVLRFRDCCGRGRSYSVDKDRVPLLGELLFCVVTGNDRAAPTINSVYRGSNYFIAPTTALCCCGVQDYRAKTGTSHLTLLLSRENPRRYAQIISKATGVPVEKL